MRLDSLVDRSLPSILGYSSVKANLGTLTNRGFELTLNANLIENKNFTWTSSGTFSFNRRKIKHLYGDMEEVKDADGVLNNDDKIFQGYTTPRYRWSWRNEFTFYKHFNLSFMMYSHVGQYGTFNRAANTGGMFDRYTIVDIPRWTKDNPIRRELYFITLINP